ncbi:MAG: hypothetical protein RI885_827 [Actinomycetota bacterium]
MTEVTGERLRPRSTAPAFDELVSPAASHSTRRSSGDPYTVPATPMLDRDVRPSPPLDHLVVAHPGAPRASLATVILAFIGIGSAQAVLIVLSMIMFAGTPLRIAFAIAVLVPGVVYAIVAAWDHRQLRQSGQAGAPAWIVAAIAPPVYLVLRWVRVFTDTPGRVRGIVAGSVVQIVATASLAVIAGAGTLALPASSADAAPTVDFTDSEVAALSTTAGIEESIESEWMSLGSTGTATCPEVPSTEAGTDVVCSGEYEGQRIEFTVRFGDALPGMRPWDVVSWTVVA